MGKDTHINELLPQARHNALISDATFWGYYSTCGLLLRLREQYRFEHNISPIEPVKPQDVGRWIEEREANWKLLEDADLRDINLMGRTYNPMDAEGINSAILNEGFVYGGGYGVYMKPVFFLAELIGRHHVGDIDVLIAGRELVRDLSIHPAMSRDNTIIARSEMVQAMLCERINEHRASKRQGMLARALEAYGLADEAPSELIAKATDEELASYIHHEVGEIHEARRLGEDWGKMIEALGQSPTGLTLRGLKDVLADTTGGGMLHHIIMGKKTGSIFLLASYLTGMRYTLLAPVRDTLKENGADWDRLESARVSAYKTASDIARRAMEIYKTAPTTKLDSALAELMKSACPLRA